MREWELIEWLRGGVPYDPRVLIGIGDDTALFRCDQRDVLLTVDMLLEGIHFDFQHCTPRAVGRKALNVNLSDIAAMAGIARAAVVAVALPAGRAEDLAEELHAGLREAAETFAVALIGGDTNRSPAGLVISVTVLGEPTGSGPVRRDGARPGDGLCVTGKLGYSITGHHLHFKPRLLEAQRLHATYTLNAMMDLSDGLGSDLFHLARESNVGVILDADAIPCALPPPGHADDRSPLQHALNDGEDFELLFALPGAQAEQLLVDQPLKDWGVPVSKIGTIVAEPGIWIRQDGQIQPLPRDGFTHRW